MFLLFLFILTGPIILVSNTEKTYFLFSDSEEMREVVLFLFEGEELTIFNSAELSHMEDVRRLLIVGKWFFVFSLIILFLYFYNFSDKKLLRSTGLSGVVFGFVLTLLTLINFDFVFRVFHLVLFPQGNWMFPYDSLIIELFSQELFFVIGVFCVSVSLASYLFCYYQGTR